MAEELTKYLAIKIAEEQVGEFEITEEMIASAPEFDTKEEASKYCDAINPDWLWVIGPKP